MKAISLLAFFGALTIPCDAFLMRSPTRVSLSTLAAGKSDMDDTLHTFHRFVAVAALSLMILANPAPSLADGQTKDFKLPPIDFSDKNRCVLSSSKMGQANAARDKLYDLRQCKLSGQDASGYDLSGVIMTDTDVSNAKFVESQFSKGYLHGACEPNMYVEKMNLKLTPCNIQTATLMERTLRMQS